MQLWTVVRFPNGRWSYGGEPSDPQYKDCEVWLIEHSNALLAVRKAQLRRASDITKEFLNKAALGE